MIPHHELPISSKAQMWSEWVNEWPLHNLYMEGGGGTNKLYNPHDLSSQLREYGVQNEANNRPVNHSSDGRERGVFRWRSSRGSATRRRCIKVVQMEDDKLNDGATLKGSKTLINMQWVTSLELTKCNFWQKINVLHLNWWLLTCIAKYDIHRIG